MWWKEDMLEDKLDGVLEEEAEDKVECSSWKLIKQQIFSMYGADTKTLSPSILNIEQKHT